MAQEVKKYLDDVGLNYLANSIKNLFSNSKADWNENDDTAYSYINNRPFYETDPVETEYLAETSISINEIYEEYDTAYGEISVNDALQINQKYTIVFDGTIYENLVCFDDYDCPNLGAPIDDLSSGSAEYPFSIYTYSENDNIFLGMCVDDTASTSHTVQITWHKTDITKIEKKFLPNLPIIGQKGTAYGAEIFNSYNTNIASGTYSHTEGYNNKALEQMSHAEGFHTSASGVASHAEGRETTASGDNSHAEGTFTTAISSQSHSEGFGTKASSNNQHVQGTYNIEDTGNKYAHIVGNGTSTTVRSNAHTLDWNGNAWFAGDVYTGGTGQDDTSNVKKLTTEEDVINKINAIFTLDGTTLTITTT